MTDEGRRLYLIRHGRASHRSSKEAETTRGRVADPPLDETGLEQVQILANRLLKMEPPAAVYVSPLQRARQTIAPFEEATGTTATVVDDLAEWYGGGWEFKEFEELLHEHPEMPSRVLRQDPIFFLAPGGEPQDAFQARVVGAVEAALAAHPAGDVWIVCHGGVINAYVGMVMRIREQEMFFLPPNTSINTIRVIGGERHVWFLADDTHLTEPELFADHLHAPAYTPATRTPIPRSSAVTVKFLSQEWADTLKTALNADDAFKQAAAAKTATLLQVIGGADGDTHYWIRIADDAIDMGVGDTEAPDATITQSYETAVALAKSELSPVTAFMTGKIKVAGNMGLLLGLQGVLSLLPAAMAAMDVEY